MIMHYNSREDDYTTSIYLWMQISENQSIRVNV